MADNSDEDVESLTNHETSLEAAAKARKRRLLALKSKIHGVQMEEEDYETEEQITKKSKEASKEFRNHKPTQESVGEQKTHVDLDIVQNEIQDHLKDVLHEKPIESVDLAMLAPRKIDWDLKRDIEKKLAKLERKTQQAIVTIIRNRLAEGKGDLASTVNSNSQV
ncbi:unnamed protein product [Caenorhabditis angaria]|uniref:Coiled-coil domain-containing protein 12 n=1 Tax=Caenorhabditis angaria TaxID=860376 RepID=A0A9P1N5L6_9PELO|nr:unnamed protein product [Caenorhabditis angaria]